jgi:hypothetical protein
MAQSLAAEWALQHGVLGIYDNRELLEYYIAVLKHALKMPNSIGYALAINHKLATHIKAHQANHKRQALENALAKQYVLQLARTNNIVQANLLLKILNDKGMMLNGTALELKRVLESEHVRYSYLSLNTFERHSKSAIALVEEIAQLELPNQSTLDQAFNVIASNPSQHNLAQALEKIARNSTLISAQVLEDEKDQNIEFLETLSKK